MENRYDIDKAPSELSFGNQGESGITAYEFDCSAWLLAYPEGALSVTFMAPNSLTVTVVPPSQAVVAEGILTLTVLQNMTAEYGLGSINVRLVDGDDIERHSRVIDVRVKKSHYAPSGEIPSVMQDWVSEVAAKWSAVNVEVTGVAHTVPAAGTIAQDGTGTHLTLDIPAGHPGVYVGTAEPTDPLDKVWINTDDPYDDELQASLKIRIDDVELKADAMASGSPKGEYATVGALEAALPTGDTGAYLVEADSHLYFWDTVTSAWVDGGEYNVAHASKVALTDTGSYFPIKNVEAALQQVGLQFNRWTSVNVKSYGAVGDGSADDTSGFAAAINAANAGNLNIYIPYGRYNITDDLPTIFVGMRIYSDDYGCGQSRRTIIHDYRDSQNALFKQDTSIDGLATGGGLANLMLRYRGVNTRAVAVSLVSNGWDGVLENVCFYGYPCGLYSSADDYRFTKCQWISCGSDVVDASPRYAIELHTNANEHRFAMCHVEKSRYMIKITDGSFNNSFSDCHFEMCGCVLTTEMSSAFYFTSGTGLQHCASFSACAFTLLDVRCYAALISETITNYDETPYSFYQTPHPSGRYGTIIFTGCHFNPGPTTLADPEFSSQMRMIYGESVVINGCTITYPSFVCKSMWVKNLVINGLIVKQTLSQAWEESLVSITPKYNFDLTNSYYTITGIIQRTHGDLIDHVPVFNHFVPHEYYNKTSTERFLNRIPFTVTTAGDLLTLVIVPFGTILAANIIIHIGETVSGAYNGNIALKIYCNRDAPLYSFKVLNRTEFWNESNTVFDVYAADDGNIYIQSTWGSSVPVTYEVRPMGNEKYDAYIDKSITTAIAAYANKTTLTITPA